MIRCSFFQISSAQVPYPGEKSNGDTSTSSGGEVSSECADVGPCLLCVARRIPPNEKPMGTPTEQFTMKLDPSGKIVGVDTSCVSSTYSQYLNKVSVLLSSNLFLMIFYNKINHQL